MVHSKFIAAAIAISAIAGVSAASAADMTMPLKAPPPVRAVSWTGCYGAVGVGYGMFDVNHYGESFPALVPATQSYDQGGRGWLGRFGGGCDYQLPGNLSRWVVGAFGEYDAMDLTGGIAPGNLALVGTEKQREAWYVGARAGYLVTPGLLTYIDGGYTQTSFNQINLSPLALAGAAGTATIPGNTYHGWFLGGGTEYALNDWLPIRGLFWRNEYRFAQYNSADLPIVSSATGATLAAAACSPSAAVVTPCGEHIKPYTQTITSSLVWRFNWQ